MKSLFFPAVIGSMFLGGRAAAALRRWTDRGEANRGWCSTLSRDYPHAKQSPAEPPDRPSDSE